MVETSEMCNVCGSHSVPKGARFCPNCGTNLRAQDAVPMVPAVPIAVAEVPVVSESSSIPSSITTNHTPAAQAIQSEINQATTTTSTHNASAAAAAASAEHNVDKKINHDNSNSNNFNSSHRATTTDSNTTAMFWKNPSPAMIQRAAKYSGMGGILFIKGDSGGCNGRGGKFTVPQTIHAGHILSGTKLDLSIADFVHPVTTITVGTVLGGFKLVVPRGVRVEEHGIGILGGFEGIRSQTINAGQVENAPLIIIQGVAILGGIKVKLNDKVPPVQVVE